jgi:CheY-like chemotaxis protein
MPTVLVVSPDDLESDLKKTVLGRGGIELLAASDATAGIEAALRDAPKLVIVALGDRDAAESFVRRLREHERTREMSVAVLLPSYLPPDEAALREVGANALLSGRPDPYRWDDALDKLLKVPARRAVRIPVRFWVWFRFPGDEPNEGRALDLSPHGMLFESARELEVGTRFEAQFRLFAGTAELTLVGEVVREAGSRDGRLLYGVRFHNASPEVLMQLEAFVEADKAG